MRCHSLISLQIIHSLHKSFHFPHLFHISIYHPHPISSHPHPILSHPHPNLIVFNPYNVRKKGTSLVHGSFPKVVTGVAGGQELQVGRRDQRREGGEVGGRLEELERVVGEGQRGHRNASK